MGGVIRDKKADLAGPGIGDYNELEKILPSDYRSLLTERETQQAIFQENDTSSTIFAKSST